MESKFAKGKWFIDHEEKRYNKHNQLCTPISVNGIIGFCYVYGDDDTSLANAQLIESAPEMFEMLSKLVRECQIRDVSRFKEAKQLLTKITTI